MKRRGSVPLILFLATIQFGLARADPITSLAVTAQFCWQNNDTSSAIRGTRIELDKGDGAGFVRLYQVGRNVTCRTVTLQQGAEWCFRAKSYTNTAESEPSNSACATVLADSVVKP